MKIVKKIIAVILAIVFAAAAGWLLFNLAWLFGHDILDGRLVGNDSSYALSLVSWFERFWPRIPLWYPLQGAGVSLFHSYPMLSTFLIIFIKQMTYLSSIEVFRMVSFATFPLTAFGIYMLAKRKIGNPVAAIFAGAFFLFNQASWIFQSLHGIFAQSFSMVFVPWSFLFFDLFLEKKLRNKNGGFIMRLAGVLAIVLTAFCFLAHPVTGLVVSFSLLGYAVLYFQFSLKLKSGFKKRLGMLLKSLILVAFCLILAFSLAAFWLIPFYSYNRLANREGLLEMGIGQLKEVSLKLQTLVGFGDFRTGDLRYDYFFFALPVLLLAGVGLLGGIWRHRSLFAWGLVAVGMAVYTSLPLYLPALVNLFRYIFTAIYFRALIATIILLPVTAGFGAFFLADWPFMILAKLTPNVAKKTPAVLKFGIKGLRFIVNSLVVFLICLFFLIRFEHRPPDKATQEQPAYGIASFNAYGPTLDEDMEVLKQDWQSVLFKKPMVTIDKTELRPAPSLIGFIQDFNLDKTNRVDVSAYSGESFLQFAPMLTEATFVNLYHYSASIIHRMWGYQQGVFYGHDSLYDNPELLKELSYWFGTEYTVIVPGFDREENYKKVGWQLVKPGGTRNNPLPVYHFPEAEGLLTVSDRPVALVIGSLEGAAYDQIFKSSNAGAFSYHDLWLVEGGERLDSYSWEELANFDLLILQGYAYKNKAKAWSLIRRFAEEGGMVFVDTGWQYVCRDWGRKNGGEVTLPEPAPVERTSWGSVSPDWASFEIDSLLGDFETSSFKPFLWEGQPWGAALAENQSLREGAKILIRDKNGIVLAMRDFDSPANSAGKGRIIWSGLNLFSHAQGAEGEKEIGVLRAVFELLISKEKSDYPTVSWHRDYPDDLEITFTQEAPSQWLLWREAFSPNWRAELVKSEKLKVKSLRLYRGGPGFVLAKVPAVEAGTTLRLEYRLGWFEGSLAKVISLLTLIFLLIYLSIGGKIEKKAGERLGGRLKKFGNKMLASIADEEDKDY